MRGSGVRVTLSAPFNSISYFSFPRGPATFLPLCRRYVDALAAAQVLFESKRILAQESLNLRSRRPTLTNGGCLLSPLPYFAFDIR